MYCFVRCWQSLQNLNISNSKYVQAIRHIPSNIKFHNYTLYPFITELNYICGHILPTVRCYCNDPLLYLILLF